MKVNAEKIKNMRNQLFWSQEELGEACGLDLRTIQRIEQTGKASLDSVRRLAGALGVAFGGGAVMGMSVVGLAVLGLNRTGDASRDAMRRLAR